MLEIQKLISPFPVTEEPAFKKKERQKQVISVLYILSYERGKGMVLHDQRGETVSMF